MKKPIYLLDTNVVSEFLKPKLDEKVMAKISENESLCAIASTTWNELLYGVNIMPEGKRKDYYFSFLIDSIQVMFPIIEFTSLAAVVQSDIRARLEKKGQKKAYADTEIAAIATASGMILVTRNIKDFEPIQEVSTLMLENWFS